MSRLAELVGRPAFRDLLHAQRGVVTHAQLIALGLTSSEARRWVRAGRWQRPYPGVYVTFTGPVPERTQVWAAVLAAGRDAVAAGSTALWLAGVDDRLRRPIQLAVPRDRRVIHGPGFRIETSETCRGWRFRARRPAPRSRPPSSTRARHWTPAE